MYDLQFTMYDVRCTIVDEDEAMDGVTELRKASLRIKLISNKLISNCDICMLVPALWFKGVNQVLIKR